MGKTTWMKIAGELMVFCADLLEKTATLRDDVKSLQEKVKELEQQQRPGYDIVCTVAICNNHRTL